MSNETNEKINPLTNSEEHQKLVLSFETEKQELKSKAEEWKNAYLKSEQEKLTRDKVIDRLEQERDDWKREAFTARKAEIEKKETREANDFLTNLTQKLDKKIEQTQKKYHPLNNYA